VVSHPDEEGKSIGINSFFEPFYHRYRFNTTSELFQKNRYYEPIEKRGSTDLCRATEEGEGAEGQSSSFSCFVRGSSEEAISMTPEKAGKGGERRTKTKEKRQQRPKTQTGKRAKQQQEQKEPQRRRNRNTKTEERKPRKERMKRKKRRQSLDL
jgi:hypothetical protein